MTLACAHRGDSRRFRENTIAAIRSAISSGADLVEIDVRLTTDDKVVVLHDATTERLWGRESNANHQTLAEIQVLGFDDVRIPTLAEVLDLFVGTEVSIMIDMELAEPAAMALKVAEESSLSSSQITWCGALDAMKIIRSLSESARILLPWNEAGMPPNELLAEVKPEFINLHYSYLSAPAVDAIHNAGYKVSLWTIDDQPTMRWAKAIGVDSITSNHLALLQQTLKEEHDFSAEPRISKLEEIDLDRAELVAHELAKWAIMVCNFMKPGTVTTKANPADLVTEVDLWIETHIREVIAANFPSHILVGEEQGGESRTDIPTWYLDPVDGTTNFANQIPWTSMSLSLALNRTPLIGVTIDPWRNEIYEARLGRGAKLNGKELKLRTEVAGDNPLAGKVVLTELAAYQPWPGMLKLLENLADSYCTMRIMGAGTLTLTSIAAGRGIGAIVGHFSPIDHLAAALIVHEAGGVVLDEMGAENLFPNFGGVMVAAPSAAKALYGAWI
jgi:myo-inositol-1(or 4)-monophosphatase/deoxyribonuclease-2